MRRAFALTAAGWLAAAVLAASGALPANAQESGADAGTSLETIEKRAEKDRARARDLAEKAEALAKELQALKQRSVKLASKTQTLETRLTRTEARLKKLRTRREHLRERLDARREQLVATLRALERIALQPPAALAVRPESPIAVARAATLLEAAVPAIEKRAARVRRNLERLETVRKRINQERTRLKNTRADLTAKREELAALMARKRRLVERTRTASREASEDARRLAREARDMRELLAALNRQRTARRAIRATDVPVPGRKPAPPGGGTGETAAARDVADAKGAETGGAAEPAAGGARLAALTRPADIRPFPDSRNSLRMPARGEVIAGYGEAVERNGTTTGDQGMTIATRPGARVVAPYDGKVVYAGPFKTYGRILIIQHGDRYHSLLAGLGRIDAIVGQWVLAGEPVGVMGDPSGQSPELYVELRRAGQPIDPAPWLARRGNKVRG